MKVEFIKKEVQSISEQLVSIRRYLHTYPELSFEESGTAEYISTLLDEWGIPHKRNIGGYGIVGLIKGNNPESRVVALRGDMDALPIVEENNTSYCSANKGVMHACGHDVHMTCLLGAVKILWDNRDQISGTIKFIFQPAEETLPGGALKMIEDGVLENPAPDFIIGQHVYPDMEVGKIGVRPGSYMASTDELNLTVTGRGGHGALTYTFDDSVHAAAEIIYKIKEKVNSQAPEGFPTVLSFGKVIAEGAYNVIPPEVEIKGTFRTFDEDWRKRVHEIINETASAVSKKHNTKCNVFINNGYPVLKNDEVLTSKFRNETATYLGERNVEPLEMRTTGEDFARFTQKIPGVFYRLGVANEEKGINSSLHSPTFDVDEKCLEIGTGVMIWSALKL